MPSSLTLRRISRYLLALVYIAAGLNHFRSTLFYASIVPHGLPYPVALVYLTGVWEVAGGLLVLPRSTRNAGVWTIIALLVAVFPANVQMSVDFYQRHHPYFWATLLRLPLQALLIWWAWTVKLRKSE